MARLSDTITKDLGSLLRVSKGIRDTLILPLHCVVVEALIKHQQIRAVRAIRTEMHKQS